MYLTRIVLAARAGRWRTSATGSLTRAAPSSDAWRSREIIEGKPAGPDKSDGPRRIQATRGPVSPLRNDLGCCRRFGGGRNAWPPRPRPHDKDQIFGDAVPLARIAQPRRRDLDGVEVRFPCPAESWLPRSFCRSSPRGRRFVGPDSLARSGTTRGVSASLAGLSNQVFFEFSKML